MFSGSRGLLAYERACGFCVHRGEDGFCRVVGSVVELADEACRFFVDDQGNHYDDVLEEEGEVVEEEFPVAKDEGDIDVSEEDIESVECDWLF